LPCAPPLALRLMRPLPASRPFPCTTPFRSPGPDRFVGLRPVPVAVSVQALSAAVPPLLLTTILSSVSDGAMSSLVIVQTVDCPFASVVFVAVPVTPFVQLHPLAGYPPAPPL